MTSTPRSLTTPDFHADHFAYRHLGLNDADRATMLAAVGFKSSEELLDATIPSSIRLRTSMALSSPLSESEVLPVLKSKFANDVHRISFIGQGYYNTITPGVIKRNVLENPAWYTAYTPYQPEISQGRLEAILNFQTMVSELTGLPLANGSLLDEATAVAEAVTMAHRVSKSKSDSVFVDRNTHPQSLAVLSTRLEPIGISIQLGDVASCDTSLHFAVVVSMPGSDGHIPSSTSLAALTERARDSKTISIAITDLLACALFTPPGQLGFDIAIGSSQRFGVPMGFGGPHAAFMATRDEHARALPGRLVGVSTDTEGRPALRLALQTREQHIRREKATSNICTAQVLLANIAGMYGIWHGPDGLKRIASRVHSLAQTIAASFTNAGMKVRNDTFFDTVACDAEDAQAVVMRARDAGFNMRLISATTFSLSVDETTTREAIVKLLNSIDVEPTESQDATTSNDLFRTDTYMKQSVFHRYHTEHEMLRYLAA